MRDVARLHAQRLGPCAIYLHKQRGIVKCLVNVDVHSARNMTHLGGKFFADEIILPLVDPGNFHINGRRRSEIQNLRDDVCRLEEELHARKLLREPLAQVVDIPGSGLATFCFQLNENFRIGCSDGAGIAVRQIDAAVRNADIVEKSGDLFLWNGFANGAIHLIRKARGFFDAQAGACAQVQADLPGVHFRKEIAAEHKNKQDGKDAESQKCGREKTRKVQRRVQRALVGFAELLEFPFEPLLIPAEEAHPLPNVLFRVILILGGQEIHCKSRNDGSRPHVGSQHRKTHGLCQRHEQIPCDARKKKHGNEDDANAERGDERGHGNLLRAVENGLHGVLAHGQVAIDVLDFHRGIIHEDADSKREASKSHDVDGLAQGAEAEHAYQDG